MHRDPPVDSLQVRYFARFFGSGKSFSITLSSFFQDLQRLYARPTTPVFVLPRGTGSDMNACDHSQSEKDHEGSYPIAVGVRRKPSFYSMFRHSPSPSRGNGGDLPGPSGRDPRVRSGLRAFCHSVAD
jgi:hypothetical protein